jgi:hypothetical protein
MEKKIDGRMIFLVFLVVFLVVTFYSIIEAQERPHSKAEVSRIIRTDFFEQKLRFRQLAGFALSTNSYSDNWYFQDDEEKGFQFYSETEFDSCKITLQEYISKYYKNTESSIAPCYVPDFDTPSGLQAALDSLHINKLHYQLAGTCEKRNVTFVYKDDLFSPERRTILFRYFPDGMCREMIETIKKSDNKWNWAIYLDKNWIAESIKKKH